MEQIIDWFKTWLNREDIYYIIVPLAVVLIGWLLQYFKGSRVEKQWKYVSEKSACDKYIYYCVRVFILGMLATIIYVTVLCTVVVLFVVKLNELVIKVGYVICISVTYIFLAKSMPESNIIFRKFKKKKKYKNEKRIKGIINKLPLALAWIIWICIFFGDAFIMKIVIVFTVIFEIVAMIIIDDARTFQFQYATFYFYGDEDDNEIEHIETCNIFQKGAWIIAKDGENDVEHRFRIKDIKHIEYIK